MPAAVETNAATWLISAALSLSLKDGIPLPPFRTWRATVCWFGLSSSRFGPTFPVAPAASSVWQPLQPSEVKIFSPGLPAPAASFDPESPLLPPPQPAVAITSAATERAATVTRTIAEGAIRRIREH